jgi:hypothetical protein
MSNTNTNQVTLLITPTSKPNAVVKSSAFDVFVNDIVPKQLTIDNCNNGALFTTDTKGNPTSWSPITMFPVWGK